ncbi:MAG: arsenate reductase ArsC [Geminicoccales bacterium]
MPTILFLCVANSARSQMAEGLARSLAPAGWRFLSAGSNPGVLNPLAVQVMAEIGIDISGQRAKGLEGVPLDEVETIVTLCAEEVCPVIPGTVQRRHWPLRDPRDLAEFRAIRDELGQRLPTLWDQPNER